MLRGSIHVQELTAPGKPCCLALKVNTIPFVPSISLTLVKRKGLCHLYENTFATVTKIQGEYIEHLVPITNLHETVPLHISIKDGHHRVFGDSYYSPLTAVGQNCHSRKVQSENALPHSPPFKLRTKREGHVLGWSVLLEKSLNWIIPEVLHRDNPAKTVLRENHYQHRPHSSEPLRSWDESMSRTLPPKRIFTTASSLMFPSSRTTMALAGIETSLF